MIDQKQLTKAAEELAVKFDPDMEFREMARIVLEKYFETETECIYCVTAGRCTYACETEPYGPLPGAP